MDTMRFNDNPTQTLSSSIRYPTHGSANVLGTGNDSRWTRVSGSYSLNVSQVGNVGLGADHGFGQNNGNGDSTANPGNFSPYSHLHLHPQASAASINSITPISPKLGSLTPVSSLRSTNRDDSGYPSDEKEEGEFEDERDSEEKVDHDTLNVGQVDRDQKSFF